MTHVSTVAILIVLVLAPVFSGCALQLAEPLPAPEAQVAVEPTPDFVLNPELRFLLPRSEARFETEDLMVGAGHTPAETVATRTENVAGEWMCEQEEGQQLIRLDPDGRISRLVGVDDAVDIGYFWFSDDELHIISDVDRAANESVFHVVMEVEDGETFLRFEQCGGNCANAANIDWLAGLKRVESQG
jgi:hypothetical protein